jgi:uncharacterized surface protein with fasciclin (FAS1) repeats
MGLVTRLLAAAVIATPFVVTTSAHAQDIVDTAAKAGSFNTLVTAVKAAGLVETLKGKGPFTVFAPTDAAFAKLPPATLQSLLKPENKKTLTSILTYHVLPGDYPVARITGVGKKQFGVASVEGSPVRVDLRRGVKVSGANVTKTDITTTNGTIHVIDTVILPPKVAAALAKSSPARHASARPAARTHH